MLFQYKKTPPENKVFQSDWQINLLLSINGIFTEDKHIVVGDVNRK